MIPLFAPSVETMIATATNPAPAAPSSVVRTLTAELTAARARHRAEVEQLRQALAAAHGENLLLRRRLGHPGQASTAGTTSAR